MLAPRRLTVYGSDDKTREKVMRIYTAAGASDRAEFQSEFGRKEESVSAEKPFEEDVIQTEGGELTLSFIGHGTLMFRYQGKIVHVDPVSREADYSKLPKADLVLITHEHGDHLDPKAVDQIRKEGTRIVLTESCVGRLQGGTVMKNGDVATVHGWKIEAVPAYNIVHKRSGGSPFHPKGVGNGYIINFDKTRVYVAGDTENTPEMKQLKDIDIAFLPMNLPYTMTPEMVAEAAKAFEPRILYPYHYGQTDPQDLVKLLKDSENIDVRIRNLR